jgi:hypothetical protein
MGTGDGTRSAQCAARIPLKILRLFAGSLASANGIFMARCFIVSGMNTMLVRARRMSLALIIIAVIDHGGLHTDYSGAAPSSSGLLRLGRDLMRLAGPSGFRRI